MGEEGSQTGVVRKQQVLGDITNNCPKKGFPLVPGKFLIANDTIRKQECNTDPRKRVLGKFENTGRAKRRIDCLPDVCGTVVDDRRDLSLSKGSNDGCSKHLSSPKAGMTLETVIFNSKAKPVEANIDLGVSHCANRMEKFLCSSDHAHVNVGNPQIHGLGEAGLRDSCTTSIPLPKWLQKPRDPLRVAGKGNQGCSQKSSGEMSDTIQTDVVAVQKRKLELGTSSILNNGSIKFVNLMENISQNSKHLSNDPLNESSEQSNSEATELLGSKIGKTKETENAQTLLKHGINVGKDLVSAQNCSCSFCLKAAYMLTDLLYQESKDLQSEINKTKRNAKFLAGRNYNHDFISGGVGNHKKLMGLESNLMQRWRTLFLHTENVLFCESAQLQSDLLKLKELRENCKREVEMISKVPSSES